MYVCICNALTEQAIAQAVKDGAASVAQLYARLDSAPQCGKCLPIVREIMKVTQSDPHGRPPMAAE